MAMQIPGLFSQPILRHVLLGSSQADRRIRFLNELREAMIDPRMIWLPDWGDGLTSVDQSGFQAVITHNLTLFGRQNKQGFGLLITFDGSTHAASGPAASNYSFGDALADLPFSCGALVNGTDTANYRPILCKWANGTPLREWAFAITTGDLLELRLYDESLDVIPFRNSSAAITMGSLRNFAATYTPSIGATAASGIVLYDQGAVLASAATEAATYLAMESSVAVLSIGSRQNAAGPTFSNYFQGTQGVTWLAGGARSAAEIMDIRNLILGYCGAG